MAILYNCGNCRDKLTEDLVKYMEIGQDRKLVFCKACNCYLKLIEPAPKPRPEPAAQKPEA